MLTTAVISLRLGQIYPYNKLTKQGMKIGWSKDRTGLLEKDEKAA